jgi:type IX secretion system PorP/SprF family membrane protein
MKRILALIFSVGFSVAALAQQQPLYSNYMLNNFINNPALAGIEDYMDTKASFRRQWTNIPGSPTTAFVSAHAALNQADLNKEELGSLPMRGASTIRFKTVAPKKIRHGVGGFVINDNAANITNNSVFMGYSIHLPLNQTWYLATGLNVGARFFRLNNSNIELRNPADAAFAGTNIPAIPDMNFGLMLYTERLYFGASTSQVFANNFSFVRDASIYKSAELTRHFYGTISYQLPIDVDFDFMPNAMVRYTTNGAPPSVDVGGKIRYQKTFWAGASYRWNSAVAGLVGFNLYKTLDLAYAFDFTTTALNVGNVGTHEVVLGIRLNNKKATSAPKIW